MPTIVDLPDENVELEFPDEMSRTDMEREIIKRFPSQAPKGPSTRAALPMPGERIATREGVTQSITQAFPAREQAIQEAQRPREPIEAPLPSVEQQKAMLTGVAQPEAEIPTYEGPNKLLRGASQVASGILNRPEYLASLLNPATATAVAATFLPEVAKQFLEDLGKGAQGDDEALGRAAAIGIPALFGVVKGGKTLTERLNAQTAIEKAQAASSAAHIDAMTRLEATPRTAEPQPLPGAPISMRPSAERAGVLVPTARELTPQEAEDVFGLGKLTQQSNELLTQSASELRQLERERTPDAISQRETAQVPLEVPPGNRGEVGAQVREQGAPEETLARTSEDDARAEAAAANVPRDITQAEAQAPAAPQVAPAPTTEPTPTPKVEPAAAPAPALMEGGVIPSPAIGGFAERAVPALESRIGQLHGLLINSDAFAQSEFYDRSFPIPREGGIIAARNTQRYQIDPVYRAKVDASIKDVTDTMVRANRQRLSLMEKPGTGAFGVDYSIGKARAGYTVNVVRAWHNEAKQKYPYTSRLGNISVREAFQNSLDAVLAAIQNKEIRQGEISIDTASYDNKGFKVTDNGIGMSDADIGQKFLSLHSTGKAVEGRFGGFGIAKAVILGPADSGTWTLRTRDNRFTHELAQANEVVQTAPRIQGTEIEVTTPEYILDDNAKRYVETTELPKNVVAKFDSDEVRNPFKGLKPQRETVVLNDQTEYEMAYYPNAPAGYNQKYLIRLVDPKTGAKLTQAIKDTSNEGFNGAVIVDIKTKAVPGTEEYPLVDSRMDMKWGAEKPVNKLIEKHSIDPLSARRAGQQFTFYRADSRGEWKDSISKIASDEGYQKVSKAIHDVWEETGKFFGSTPTRPFTPLNELDIKIDKGFSGYKGGTIFQAKHLAAFEAVSRLMSQPIGASVSRFYGLLSKVTNGVSVNAEHAAGGVMGLNFLNIDKTSLKNPYTYALYLRDLVAHELTHDFFGPHNEEFSSKLGDVLNKTSDLFPHILKISEAVLGKEVPKQIVEKRVPVKVEVPVEKRIFVDRYLTPEQREFIYDNYENTPSGQAKDELYSPNPRYAGQRELQFEPGRTGERNLGLGGTPEVPGVGGGVEQPSPPSVASPEPGSVGPRPISIGEETIAPTPPSGEPSVGPGSASPDPATSFSSSVKDVPVKSKVAANLAEKAAEKQNLGITALPPIGGTGLAKVGNAIKAGLRELRDIPKFTAFKETVNRWFGQNQKTSLEVRALQKDIESRVPTEARREAITNYLQSDGDTALLDTWSKGTKNRKRKAGYEAAKNLTPDELKIAQAVRKLYDDYLTKAQAYDLVETGIEDYVTQVWKRPFLGGSQFAQFASKLSPQFRFGKQRVFENFFEGEQAGFKPVTKDISKLVGLYVSEMGKTIATRDFIKDLTTKDAADGRPLAAPSGVGNAVLDKNATPSIFVRPNAKNKTLRDYSRWTHPALTGWKWVAEDPISGAPVLLKGNLVLHPDIAGHVENILSRSAIKRWYDTPSTPMGVLPKALAKGLDQWQGVTKQIMLGFFAPFHHVQEATHALGHRVNPVFDLPALNHTDPNLQRAMNHGLAVAGDNAAMESFREGVGAGKIFGKIPIVGEWANQWSDFLFNEYIPRLKWKTYQDILKRNLERYQAEIGRGDATIDDVEYLSSKQTNAAFGHQNYADLGRNPTIQHIARTLALAPDFLEARTRFFGQALKGAIGKEGREQLMAMATLAGTFWVGSRIINKLGSGDYHNEEPFGVVLGGRTYTMRSVPEDAWRAFKDSRKFIYGRVSPIIGRGTIELLTGKNYRGEKTTALETMQDLLASWVPITLRNLPGVERLSPSQVNRSVNAWEAFLGAMGVQISRHSPISKGYQLGEEYMKAQGVKEDRGSYPVSKYQQLRYALEDSDLEKAAVEIRRLRDSEKMTSSKLQKGFHESLFHPWTKSEAMDRQFKRSLTPENKMLVNEAEEQRRRVWQRFVKARGMSFIPQP